MKGPSKSILGVVEGFYGVFYTFPQRSDLISFLGEHGFNWYLYAPKNDRQHRARWFEMYPTRVMEGFAENIKTARAAGVKFCYSISPGGSIGYSSEDDFKKLTRKFQAFFDLGVRAFGLLYDDINPIFHYQPDQTRYSSPAEAQACLANRLYAWLQSLDSRCTLHICPVDYHGRAPFSRYLTTFGSELNPSIGIFYTGPEICSPEITANDARQFEDAVYHKPILWDNYPVNDLGMQGELHIGPLTGRSSDLPFATNGILANAMSSAEASKIALLCLADYWRGPDHYNPQESWEKALVTLAGEESSPALRLIAESCFTSCLGSAGQTLAGLASEALHALQSGQTTTESAELRGLEAYLTEIDEATYHLKFRMENLALRNDLLPWIEVLEHWMWMTRFSLQVLRAIETETAYLGELKRVHEYQELIQTHPKRVMAQPLFPLVEYILRRVEENQRSRVSLEWVASPS